MGLCTSRPKCFFVPDNRIVGQGEDARLLFERLGFTSVSGFRPPSASSCASCVGPRVCPLCSCPSSPRPVPFTQREVHQLYHKFRQIDKDWSHEIELSEFYDYFNLSSTPFADKTFLILDTDESGSIGSHTRG